MSRVVYELSGGLSSDQLASIRNQSLQILARTGVQIDHPQIRAYLASIPGVTRAANRICYAEDFVAAWIECIRGDNLEYSYNRADNAFRLVGPYMDRWYLDPATGERRYGTAADLAASVRLMDVYGAYGPSPMHVQTVPEPLRQLTTFRSCVLNSREIGGWSQPANEWDADYLCRLGEAAGRPPPYGCEEIPISPLRLNHVALDMIYRRRGAPNQFTGLVYGGGAVPMPGATAPIRVPACLAQGLAEALAAYITPKLIDDRVPGYCSFGGFLFDMKRMQPGQFFPESTVYNAMTRQLIRHVLGRTMGSSFRSGSFEAPGNVFRAGFQAAVAALAGARTFLGLGTTGSETFSPVAFVLGADIVRHVARFCDGLDCDDDDAQVLATIAHGADSGMYLDHPSALGYRDAYLEPELFFRHTDPKTLLAAARERVEQDSAAASFELPADRRRDVENVYRAAVRELQRS